MTAPCPACAGTAPTPCGKLIPCIESIARRAGLCATESTLRRYSLIGCGMMSPCGSACNAEMCDDECGEWVRESDALAAIEQAREEERKRWRQLAAWLEVLRMAASSPSTRELEAYDAGAIGAVLMVRRKLREMGVL